VKDIPKMIGRMIWDAREEELYLERNNRSEIFARNLLFGAIKDSRG
jgi:hypothetical protein